MSACGVRATSAIAHQSIGLSRADAFSKLRYGPVTGDLRAASFAPPVPVPAPDIIPLLPRGDTVFEDLPMRALVLDALGPAIGDGLIVIRRSPGVGVILIRGGRITDTYAVEPERRAMGDEAITRIRSWDDAIVSAWRLGASVVDVLPPLVRCDPLYADLRLDWIIWNRLLSDLRARQGTYVVELTTVAGRGVTSIRDGVQVATYTDKHRELGDPSLVDDLAAAGSGAIRVLHDAQRSHSMRDIAPAASGNLSDHPAAADEESTITHVFGVAQSPPRPELVPVAAGVSGSDTSVAQLLPELKRLVQERLHHSSLRLEILLEDAAANNASLDAVVAEVRATPIRGVMQSTLDDLADEMLALGER